jgi:phytoene dehydrogenase-like protein
MDKQVIIIGAGIAGLSAGCYLQMNGYKTRIFEMDTRPGGVCTAWKRKGYTIDGCMHWLVGTNPSSAMHRVWDELGLMQRHTFINHEEYLRVEGKDGRFMALYTDPDRLERHLNELAPEDGPVIEDFVKALRRLRSFDLPVGKPRELQGPLDNLRMVLSVMPYLGVLRKWQKARLKDFVARLKNPFLREAFTTIVGDMHEFPMMALLMPMAWVRAGNAGYPLGGSFELARTIEQRYLALGGMVDYNARVAKVLVENDRAVGVRLADGSEHRGDTVISAADGHTTIFEMLDGKYLNDTIRGYYDNMPLFPPLLHVAYGVARRFDELPHSVSGFYLPLEEPLTLGGKEYRTLNLHMYNFDPSLAPEGKTVVKFIIQADYDYWEALSHDRARYDAEKERVADTLLQVLEKRFPGITPLVEMRDVATPMTWVRYTGNWRASFEGWMIDIDSFGMQMSKTLPGLQNFYMVGQWVEPGGGLPPAATSGRGVAQILCKRDGKKFVAMTA